MQNDVVISFVSRRKALCFYYAVIFNVCPSRGLVQYVCVFEGARDPAVYGVLVSFPAGVHAFVVDFGLFPVLKGL